MESVIMFVGMWFTLSGQLVALSETTDLIILVLRLSESDVYHTATLQLDQLYADRQMPVQLLQIAQQHIARRVLNTTLHLAQEFIRRCQGSELYKEDLDQEEHCWAWIQNCMRLHDLMQMHLGWEH